MASDVQTLPSKTPATKAGLAKWLEDYHSRLENGTEAWCKPGAANEYDDAEQRYCQGHRRG
eukprot:9859851-Prorocentrum_lima.AAC.1